MQYDIIEDNLNTLKFAKDVAEYILEKQGKITESTFHIVVEKGAFSLPEFKKYKYDPTKKLMATEPKWEHEKAYGTKGWQIFKYLCKVFQGSALFHIPENLPLTNSKFTLAVWNINYDGVAKVSEKLGREIASLQRKRPTLAVKNNSAKKYSISCTKRKIIINNRYLISEMQFGRYTTEWFEYIFAHPNKEIAIEEIREKTGTKNESRVKSFHKFLNQINFSGDIRSLFFDAGKSRLKFHNNLSGKTLAERAINLTKLDKAISKLDKIA